jgi:flagellar biosynthesis GTPase FlhF
VIKIANATIIQEPPDKRRPSDPVAWCQNLLPSSTSSSFPPLVGGTRKEEPSGLRTTKKEERDMKEWKKDKRQNGRKIRDRMRDMKDRMRDMKERMRDTMRDKTRDTKKEEREKREKKPERFRMESEQYTLICTQYVYIYIYKSEPDRTSLCYPQREFLETTGEEKSWSKLCKERLGDPSTGPPLSYPQIHLFPLCK